MASAEEKLDWIAVKLDVQAEAKAYEAKRAADKVAREAKERFEALVTARAQKAKLFSATETLVFSYRFGKVSFAIKPIDSEDDPKPKKDKKEF